jgi:hypothetical protein
MKKKKRHEVKTHKVKGKNGVSVRVKHPRGKGGGTKKKSKTKKPSLKDDQFDAATMKKLNPLLKKMKEGRDLSEKERDFLDEIGESPGATYFRARTKRQIREGKITQKSILGTERRKKK